MATVIEQLGGIADDLDAWIAKLDDAEYESHELTSLATRISKAATIITLKATSFQLSSDAQVWKASEKFRIHAESTVDTVIESGRLKNSTVLSRNIIQIFTGPTRNDFNVTKDAKTRIRRTKQRCEMIQRLKPDGIVSWALSYRPSTWAAGNMADKVFQCLVDDIEPNDTLAWPDVVCETLRKLKGHGRLQGSSDYERFVNGEDKNFRGGLN